MSLAECGIKSQPLDLTYEINNYEYVTCFDHDLVDQDPPDRRAPIHVL